MNMNQSGTDEVFLSTNVDDIHIGLNQAIKFKSQILTGLVSWRLWNTDNT